MWQEPLCVVPFEILKPDIKHTDKTFRHITTHRHTIHIKSRFMQAKLFHSL